MPNPIGFVPPIYALMHGKDINGFIRPMLVDTNGQLNNLNKGWFANEAALLVAYPNGIADPTMRNGWFAVNGDTDTVWVWDAGTNVWVDSTVQGTVTQVDGKTGNVDGRYTQAIFFGKAGNNSDSGLSYIQRKLTLASAKTAASALTPASGNQIVIACEDAGTYTESYTNVAFVHLIAPAAKIIGNIVIAENSMIDLGILNGNLTVDAAKVLRGGIKEITGTITKNGKMRGFFNNDAYVANIVTEQA